HAVALLEADVLRLDVAVDDAVDLAAAHLRRELMAGLQHGAELERDAGRPVLVQGAVREHLRQVGAGHVLHVHPEEVAVLSPLVDRRHLRRHAGDLLLEGDAVLLRFEHLRIGAVGAHDLEGDLAAGFRVPGQIDVADGSATEEVAQLEPADLVRRKHRHGFRRALDRLGGAAGGVAGVAGRGTDTRTASARGEAAKELQAKISSPRSGDGSTTPPPPLPSKRFSTMTGRAVSRTSTPGRGAPGARPLRRMRLFSSVGAELPAISRPPPGLSCTKLARTVERSSPETSMPAVAAPVISIPCTSTLESASRSPIWSGVVASPAMRKPESTASSTPWAEMAGTALPAGGRITAPRGTRLTRSIPERSWIVSRYSPGPTSIICPGAALASASVMVPVPPSPTPTRTTSPPVVPRLPTGRSPLCPSAATAKAPRTRP